MTKMIKNPGDLLRTATIVSVMAIPLLFAGCKTPDDEITDTISPDISISSPLEQRVYDSNTVPFNWTIEEANFGSAWYSTDNEQTKNPIGKSGTTNLDLPNGYYVIIAYADDKYNNFSKKNISFSVNKIPDTTLPKITISSPIKNKVYDVNEIVFSWSIYEANFKSAWYSIDNSGKISIAKSGSENKIFENGTHKIVVGSDDLSGNASKDSVIFTADKHTWKYFVNPFVQPDSITKPIIWNNFTTMSQRNAYIDDRLYNYDKTDTINAITSGFVCTDFARQLEMNFNGHPELGYDPARGLQNNGWHNIPMYIIYLGIPGSSLHTIDGILVGDDFTNINDWRFIESEADTTYTPNRLKQFGVTNIEINYTYAQDKLLSTVKMFEFILDGNNEWVDSGYRNPGLYLKEKRGK
jgi:hypothetical protein